MAQLVVRYAALATKADVGVEELVWRWPVRTVMTKRETTGAVRVWAALISRNHQIMRF